jgi:hypothetical protein
MSDHKDLLKDWLQIVRGEYLEIPGLQLTRGQVRRLWGLDDPACTAVLASLIHEGFLRLTVDGRYSRTSVHSHMSMYGKRAS